MTPSAHEGVARSQQPLGWPLAENSPDRPQGWARGLAAGLCGLPLQVLVQKWGWHRVCIAWFGFMQWLCLGAQIRGRQTLLQELSVGGSLPPLETSLWGKAPLFGEARLATVALNTTKF